MRARVVVVGVRILAEGVQNHETITATSRAETRAANVVSLVGIASANSVLGLADWGVGAVVSEGPDWVIGPGKEAHSAFVAVNLG